MDQKFDIKEWSTPINKNLLGLCILNPWLLCIVGKGVRFHVSQAKFYSTLAEILLDKTKDTIGRRRGSTALLDGPQMSSSRIGIPPITNSRKRCRKDGSITNSVYEGRCKVCKGGQKSKYLRSEYRDSKVQRRLDLSQ